jgi:pimeloyl-ACP methyl ester carboxylesterase
MNLGYPVWTVDLPGHGRSPMAHDFASQGLQFAVDALHELLQAAGPSVIMGHSMGGHTTFRTVGHAPPKARANIKGAVFLASTTAPELIEKPPFPPIPEHQPQRLDWDRAKASFCNSDQFPKDAVDNYLPLLVPESARAYNEFLQPGVAPAAGGPAIFDGIPVLMLGADQDMTVTKDRVKRNADYFGAEMAMLSDWGFPGHGHCFMIEHGNDAIAQRIHEWVQAKVTAVAA